MYENKYVIRAFKLAHSLTFGHYKVLHVSNSTLHNWL